jgi:formylglycine-generating enzyme required for sulfatase activity
MKTPTLPSVWARRVPRILLVCLWMNASWLATLAFGGSAPILDWHFEFSSGGVPEKLVWQGEPGCNYDLWSSGDMSNWSHADGFPKTGTGAPIGYAIVPGTRGFFRILVVDPNHFVLIPAGSFLMGDGLGDGDADELPVHQVSLGSFFIQSTEVTNDQMAEVLNWAYSRGKLEVSASTVKNAAGDKQELLDLDDADCRIAWNSGTERFLINPTKGSGYPCLEVTWFGAAAYCNWRSEMEGLTPCYSFDDWSCNFQANGYRLPTEAEWERAARGGVASKRFPWGDTITHAMANYISNADYAYDTSPTRGYNPEWNDGTNLYPAPVGSFAANAYGLYDMAGNVWEWCNDRYASGYYANSPVTDPRGPDAGASRTLRGGAWIHDAKDARCANRQNNVPTGSYDFLGFRTARRKP